MWQYSKLVKYPLENQYFASYIAIAAVYFEHICIIEVLHYENVKKSKGMPVLQILNFMIYKCIQNKPLRSRYMKQNTDFQEGISQA